jgi:basic amino acid/polyamine antiporter, APA family
VKPLGKSLGAPALFGIVQGFVAASVYFSVGLVALRALGFTWLVFLAGGLLFALVVVSYVEGASLHQERGGATVIARFAFNELVSFIAGWAICLDYLILIAICAFATTDYAAVFWDALDSGPPEFFMAAALVLFVAWWNARASDAPRYNRAVLLVLGDLGLQLLIVAFGLAFLFDPDVLTDPAAIAGSPSMEDMLFAFPIVLVAFSGLDVSSGLAGQVAIGRRGLRRLIAARMLAAIVPYVGIALVASAALPDQPGRSWIEAPMLAVVDSFSQDWLREPLRYVVAVSAVAVLAAACNAAMLGVSRLGYSLALNRQIPSRIGYLHPRTSTPVVIIGTGAVIALLLLLTADLEFLLGISAFGATLAFTIVCLSVCRLRWREPDRDRPYRMPFNVRVRGGELPVPAALGTLLSGAAFAAVLAYHGSARWVGLGWTVFGVLVYVVYRLSEDKPLLKRITVPEKVLTRKRAEAEYGSILVPVLGTPLDDDIMQTAGRLAADEGDDDGDGAVIEALWVFEVPLALPLDTSMPDEELARARKALARAKAVGEEYEGVEVATAVVRARRAGEAIVREAKRRGVEAIILAAEEPTRTRGGLVFGGKQGLRDSFVGDTTRYVVNKASARVLLTAPPAKGPDPTRVTDETIEVPSGHTPVPGS